MNFLRESIETALREEFGFSVEIKKTPKQFGLFCFVESVKVDIVRFPHPLIANVVIEEGIRMYSDNDICAMKIQAMLGSGVKKDFWDIAKLLKKYSMAQIISWHKEKYAKQYLAISIPQALLYFDDADESEDPISLKGQTWETVKKSMQQTVSDFLK